MIVLRKPNIKVNTVVALGFFDGVHLGHKEIIKKTVDIAKENNLKSVVLTFKEHPAKLFSKKNVPILTDNEDKCEIFEKCGIDYTLMMDFRKIINFTPQEFFEQILIKSLNAKHIVCGFHYTFGINASGNADTLKKLCDDRVGLTVVPPVKFENKIISSSGIREFIKEGDMRSASLYLGKNYSLNLPVVKGKQLGRKMSIPTINQNLNKNSILPKFGVYATITEIDGRKYKSITNVGTRPTVKDNDTPNVETYIIDANIELYNKKVKVEFIEKIRDEKKFGSIEALKNQIYTDIETVKEILK